MDWISIAQLIVAGATLILACIAVWSILETRKWNKNVDNWNQRNEKMRVFPFLSFKPTGSSSDVEQSQFRVYRFTVKNTGQGPIVRKDIFTQHRTQHGHGANIFTEASRGLGVGETEEISIKMTLTERNIYAKIFDIFGRTIDIEYIWDPNQEDRPPSVKSIKVDGKEYQIPEFRLINYPE